MIGAIIPGRPAYLFDDELIGRHQRVARRWASATVFPEPVVVPDRPWEERTLEFPSIVKIDDGFRLYYTDVERPSARRKLMVAESHDGFRWVKPEVSREERDFPRSNVLLRVPGIFNSPNVVQGPEPGGPFKMLAFQAADASDAWAPDWGIYSFQSPDGLTWSKDAGQRMRSGDRNTLFASAGGTYVSFNRQVDAVMVPEAGGRAIYRSESVDFQTWEPMELTLAPDLDDDVDVEFYGMTVFERHGWFFGLLEVWRRSIDVMEIQLVLSRDSQRWTRPAGRRQFIGPAHPWNSRWNSAAMGTPSTIGDQLVFFINGRSVGHDFDAARQHGVIGFATLPIDRFCAIAGARAGIVQTRTMIWPGGDLVINADTRASAASHPLDLDGEIRVEVLDEHGSERVGWAGDAAATFVGNTYPTVRDRSVRWPGDVSLDRLAGSSIALRFHLDHSRLYTFAAGGG